MSTCTKWVTRLVITCENWATKVDYECTKWADEGDYKCEQWADEGDYKCEQWADEGHNECESWGKKCHWYTPWNCVAEWFCKGWYWVAKWVCKGWYWVAKWVCKAWYWVAKWVCKAFAWVVKAVCVVFSWALMLVCVAWDWLRCLFVGIFNAIASLFGRTPAKRKVDRVFVLMLENRSFDHMFAFTKIPTLDVARPSDTNTSNGQSFSVSQPAEFSLKGVDKDPPHEFNDALHALAGMNATYNPGVGYPPVDNSGFVASYVAVGGAADRAMKCFSPDQLPVLNTLAREFAICDAWFSSLPGPTWPNRFFAMAASSGGLDDSPSTFDVATSVAVNGYRFWNGNIFDKLDDKCIEWKVVEGDEFPVAFALYGMNLNALQGRFQDFDDFVQAVKSPAFAPKYVFIEPQYGESSFGLTGPGDYTCGNSMHPLDDVTRGERLIKDTYEAIRNSPHWDRSLLIVTWDEHGGFYDHVKPPNGPPEATPPGDTPVDNYDHHGFKFDQLGVRVPALIISPYVERGVVDKTIYDHSSILATVERLFGFGALTKRDANANDALHLLTRAAPRTDAPTTLPDPAVNPDAFDCEDDVVDLLLRRRSDLRLAKRGPASQIQEYVDVADEPVPSSTHLGFAQVALMRVLLTARYPERELWLQQFRSIKTQADAELFMVEAKLKIRHDIDFKRPTPTDRRRRGRAA